jgi:hypothetical protein
MVQLQRCQRAPDRAQPMAQRASLCEACSGGSGKQPAAPMHSRLKAADPERTFVEAELHCCSLALLNALAVAGLRGRRSVSRRVLCEPLECATAEALASWNCCRRDSHSLPNSLGPSSPPSPQGSSLSLAPAGIAGTCFRVVAGASGDQLSVAMLRWCRCPPR